MAKQSTVTSEQAKTAKKAPAPQDCRCGCGLTVKPGRRFRPGHDARYKGTLLKQFDAGDEDAGATLVKNGWKSQAELDERTARATERTEAKARREADREGRVTAKAQAQAAKAAKTTESEAA